MRYIFMEGLTTEGLETSLEEMRHCYVISMGSNIDGFWILFRAF